MALGALAVVEEVAAVGPVKIGRYTLVGDGAYSAGGSAGLLAKLKALHGENCNILSVQGEGPNGDAHLEYDHAAEKLFVRVMSTGVESAVANQSGITYGLVITRY